MHWDESKKRAVHSYNFRYCTMRSQRPPSDLKMVTAAQIFPIRASENFRMDLKFPPGNIPPSRTSRRSKESKSRTQRPCCGREMWEARHRIPSRALTASVHNGEDKSKQGCENQASTYQPISGNAMSDHQSCVEAPSVQESAC